MDKENDRYTFMKPKIACSETGFKGRSDLILYYDMLNRMENYFELNTICLLYTSPSPRDA